MNKNVEFISFKEDVYNYMLSSDYVIVPSYSESFCLVLAEAIYLKKMCIATDTAGSREILDNGKYGLIVENSIEGIISGIMKVLEDNSLKSTYERSILDWSYNFENKYILERIYDLLKFSEEEL